MIGVEKTMDLCTGLGIHAHASRTLLSFDTNQLCLAIALSVHARIPMLHRRARQDQLCATPPGEAGVSVMTCEARNAR